VGSEITSDGGYWADAEGGIISVSNFGYSVVDVPFESTSKDAELNFVAEKAAIPEKGTAVEVVLTPLPDAERSPYARSLVEVDGLGRLKADGQPVAMEKLRYWASAYTDKHAKGQVVIRTSPRTMVYDIQRVREEVRLGGVFDVVEQHRMVDAFVPPRTQEQAAAALAQWREKFANPRDYIEDPGVDAKSTLDRLDGELRELDRLKALCEDYRRSLAKDAAAYTASTRPAQAK
jgi:hypothetical protein